MARNPDPKPGRWILPLIVIGMVGFTYVFVNALEERVVESAATSTTTSSTLTPIDTEETVPETTSTTVDPETQAYLDQVTGFVGDLDGLTEEMTQVNAQWDAREVSYGSARDTIRDDLNPRIAQWADRVAAAVPPADLADEHALLVDATSPVVSASEAVLAGLQSSDTGEARQAALVEFGDAVAAFKAAAG